MEMHSKTLDANKTALWSLKMLIMLIVCLFVFYFNGLSVHAEIASGTYDGVDWQITDDGELIIGKEGETQEFTNSLNRGPSLYPWSSYRSTIKTASIKGTVKGNGSMVSMFSECNALTNVDLSGFDTTNVTDMACMFNKCSSLTNVDVSGFKTSNVTRMDSMFYNCKALNSLDISNFDTSKVTRMDSMFNGCTALTTLNTSRLNTSNVTDMGSMFKNCKSLTSLDVSNFNTANVTSMAGMFYNCQNLTSLDVSGFNTSQVIYMHSMFDCCYALSNLNVSRFNTSKVIDMSYMFEGCRKLTSLDLSGFDTSQVTTMQQMFYDCQKLADLNVSRFNTSKVTNMASMFQDCRALIDLDASSFNTSNVTSMGSMFYNCNALTNLDLSSFDTSNVTAMSRMFYNCYALTNLSVSGFKTENVLRMDYMFSGCQSLTNLDVSGFNTSNVTNMYQMFNNCRSLTSLDVSGFDTSNVTKMYQMFTDCSSLTSLDVSGFDTSNVTEMYQMFNNCKGLTSLDVSRFDTSNVTNMSSMFYNCSGLTSLDVSRFDTSNVTNMYQMFYNCSGLTSLDVSGFDTSKVTNMTSMFNGCSKLSFINLGEDFSFTGKSITSASNQAILPTPPSASTTGKWIKSDESAGPYTPEELRDNYTPAMAGEWVWEAIPTEYTITFTADASVTGSMAQVKPVAAEDYTLPTSLFGKFGYKFDHWDDGNGHTYANKATIPANTYAAKDQVTLTAVFVERDKTVTLENGTFDFTLMGGEKASFPDIPAGTAYQVWEETPDGWVLVEQNGGAGEIVPVETAKADFTNDYQPGRTRVQFFGTKLLDNQPAADGTYSFSLYEGRTLIETVMNGDKGFIQFEPIEYDNTMLGTHTYTIKETEMNDENIMYDTHKETVTVVVADDGHGNLTSTVTYDDDGIVFKNTSKPGTLKINKSAEGLSDENKNTMFRYKITLTNEKGQPISDDIYWYTEN